MAGESHKREPEGSSSAAAAVALGSAAQDPSVAEDARHYLRKQVELTDLEIENLRKQDEYETSHLRWRRFHDQMSGVLQLSLALVGIVIVAAVATAIWNARQADGVVIEAFSVPPDLAAKGVTGQVVATELQDKIAALQTATFSYRAPASYANNWGDDIKVQIPDTGVSIGEFNRYLRQWLGHETHITGEVWRTPDGIAVTARAGSAVSPTLTGTDADLPKLIGQAAEAIYRSTQPYRYSIHALQTGNDTDGKTVLAGLSRDQSSAERAWAHIGLAYLQTNKGNDLGTIAEYRRAIAEQPGFSLAYGDLASSLQARGRDEEALATARKSVALGAGEGGVAVNPAYADAYIKNAKANLAVATNDPLAALEFDRQARAAHTDDHNNWEYALLADLSACGLLHDIACLHDAWTKFDLLDAESPTTAGYTQATREGTRGAAEEAMGDWADSIAHITPSLAALEKAGKAATPDMVRERAAFPALAVDYANLGDIAKAKALIAQTPLDCTVCLFGRGVVAEKSGDRGGAARWFARADTFGPSFPFVPVAWGRMLLASGDTKGAIAKFTIASQRSPHFADPLEGWGEALMLQNRSDLALAKFEAAAKHAPNWGRLHLKWGEALYYAGKKDEAKRQFTIAASLFLTPSEKSEHARASHG